MKLSFVFALFAVLAVTQVESRPQQAPVSLGDIFQAIRDAIEESLSQAGAPEEVVPPIADDPVDDLPVSEDQGDIEADEEEVEDAPPSGEEAAEEEPAEQDDNEDSVDENEGEDEEEEELPEEEEGSDAEEETESGADSNGDSDESDDSDESGDSNSSD